MRPARKARKPHEAAEPPGAAALARLLASRRCVVFTGAGVSASAGMSAFSDDNGLYERARKRYKLDSGVRMFYGSFFTNRPRDCQAFLADVYAEACSAAPTEAHVSLARLQRLGLVSRHVTLNIDGLHRRCDDGGKTTTELHGCVRDAVCRTCGSITPMTPRLAALFRSAAASNPQCEACPSRGLLRPRVLLYNDPEQHLVIPGDVEDVIGADCAAADCVVWAGISFLQSASVEHFRRVRRAQQHAGSGAPAVHIIVNPCEEAAFNLTSAVANADGFTLLTAVCSADEFFTQWARGAEAALTTAPPDPGLVAMSESQQAEVQGSLQVTTLSPVAVPEFAAAAPPTDT